MNGSACARKIAQAPEDWTWFIRYQRRGFTKGVNDQPYGTGKANWKILDAEHTRITEFE